MEIKEGRVRWIRNLEDWGRRTQSAVRTCAYCFRRWQLPTEWVDSLAASLEVEAAPQASESASSDSSGDDDDSDSESASSTSSGT